MYKKQSIASIILILSIVLICFSCNKNNNTATVAVPTSVYANIDSVTGKYAGITSGDSLYTYTDSATGQVKQWVHSYSWPDTLLVTSADTTTITVTSKFYTVSFPYQVGSTYTSINVNTDIGNTETVIGTVQGGQNVSLSDTTDGDNHLIINFSNGQKSTTSNVYLYSR